MPNRAAKQRKMDRAAKNASIKKYKRELSKFKVVKVVQNDGHWYNKKVQK